MPKLSEFQEKDLELILAGDLLDMYYRARDVTEQPPFRYLYRVRQAIDEGNVLEWLQHWVLQDKATATYDVLLPLGLIVEQRVILDESRPYHELLDPEIVEKVRDFVQHDLAAVA